MSSTSMNNSLVQMMSRNIAILLGWKPFHELFFLKNFASLSWLLLLLYTLRGVRPDGVDVVLNQGSSCC